MSSDMRSVPDLKIIIITKRNANIGASLQYGNVIVGRRRCLGACNVRLTFCLMYLHPPVLSHPAL